MQQLERLPEILQEMEDVTIAQMPHPTSHEAMDRLAIRVDTNFALRHFLDDAASMSSGRRPSFEPSLQVSSLEVPDETNTETTTFHTAPMSEMSVNTSYESSGCIRLSVCNIGPYQPIVLQVEPSTTIATLKEIIRARAGLPHAHFELMQASHLLDAQEMSLEAHNIPQDATLACVDLQAVVGPAYITITAKSPRGDTSRFQLATGETVQTLKQMFAEDQPQYCNQNPVHMLYAGSELQDHNTLHQYRVKDEAQLYAVVRSVSSQRANAPASQASRRTKIMSSKSGDDFLARPLKRRTSSWKAPLGVPWVRMYGLGRHNST